jgi:hypothetical protein
MIAITRPIAANARRTPEATVSSPHPIADETMLAIRRIPAPTALVVLRIGSRTTSTMRLRALATFPTPRTMMLTTPSITTASGSTAAESRGGTCAMPERVSRQPLARA